MDVAAAVRQMIVSCSCFARDHDEEKLIKILRKTWKKMSDRGHAAALKLNLGPRELELISKAIS